VSADTTVTILVPTRGRPEQLRRLLASLRQTGHLPAPGVDVLVVDNNPPGSAHVRSVAALAASYGALRIPGPGPKAAALNTAARTAAGEFLVFLDDDTTIAGPEWLAHLIGAFDAQVGYVAGDVRARRTTTPAQAVWEAKGGLSKGHTPVQLTPPAGRHTRHAWRLKRVAAGANCAIRRAVFERIGGFCERLGPGTTIGHGESLEIVDRILRAGHTARYTPAALVWHDHPDTLAALRAKLRLYARGDTAVALHLAATHGDLLAALWALPGHQLYRIRNLALALLGRYRLPASCAAASLLGSLEGIISYIADRSQKGSRGDLPVPTRRPRAVAAPDGRGS
jgi:GT2 family glycosyltransferase